MITVETLPRIGERRKRVAEGMNSRMTYLIHCKNLKKQ
jgi:hypothetical protein